MSGNAKYGCFMHARVRDQWGVNFEVQGEQMKGEKTDERIELARR